MSWSGTWSRSTQALFVICVYGALHFLYVYWTHPFSPALRLGIDRGWLDWPDQLSNLHNALELAQFQRPAPLHYGIGYGVVAVPFVWLNFYDPFTPINFLLYIGTLAIYCRIACLFLSPEVSLITLVLLSHETQFLDFFVEPWSNSLTAFCMGVLLLLFVVRPPSNIPTGIIIGLCVSFPFAARYGDMLMLIPVVLVFFWTMIPTWRERVLISIVAGIAAMPLVLLVAWVHFDAFGSPFTSPYVQHMSSYTGANNQEPGSRSFSYLGNHLVSLLFHASVLDPSNLFPPVLHGLSHRALLSYYFLIIFSGIGLVVAVRTQRPLILAFSLSLLAALLYYGTYWATAPHQLRFHVLRFFSAWQPLLVIMGATGLVWIVHADWRTRATWQPVLIGLGTMVLLVSSLYALGRWVPPFPDWSRTIPTTDWRLTASVNGREPYHVIAKTVTKGWHATGVQPSGTSFTIDMGRVYRLDALFLAQSQHTNVETPPLTLSLSIDQHEWQRPASLQQDTTHDHAIGFQFWPTHARYIRLSLAHESSEQGWAIDEIYAYGTWPLAAVSPDLAWFDQEYTTDNRPYQFIPARSFIKIHATQTTHALLSMDILAAAHPLSTLDIIDPVIERTLATVHIEPGRRITIGPLPIARGSSRFMFVVREGERPASTLFNSANDEQMVSLALHRLRICPVEGR